MPSLKYRWTAEQDDILRAAYAVGDTLPKLTKALTWATGRIGYPRHMVRLRAQRLGLSNDTRRPWTRAEIELLREHQGEWSAKRLAQVLHRAVSTVESRMDSLKISRRVIEGYSAMDVARLLGVAPETVARWERQGLLRRRDGRIQDGSVRNLIHQHSELYSLRRVDEVLFKAMVFEPTVQESLRPVGRVGVADYELAVGY